MGRVAELVRSQLGATSGPADYRLPLFLDYPVPLGADLIERAKNQHCEIKEFLTTVSSVAQSALIENNSIVTRLLFSEPIMGMDVGFHRTLPEACWKPPLFYRTDQAVSGKIYEIQAPGSGWGDVPLLARSLTKMGFELPSWVLAFEHCYAQTIVNATGVERPRVLHMLDAASSPGGMRFLMSATRPHLRYWGLDGDVSMRDVDFVTAHSVASLVGANFFSDYLDESSYGKVTFGLPPNLLYDQKAIYALPFHRETRAMFSDEIRELFPFTTPIEGDGFYDISGDFIRLCDFRSWKKNNERWFLKYGGTDLSRNWGSRGVWMLDKGGIEDLLLMAARGAAKGEIWLIQQDVSRKDEENLPPSLSKIRHEEKGRHLKLSVFYGGESMLGTKVMTRRHFKVHGQNETLVGLGI